ncbi:flagellar filament capping protein FliD [Enterococcus lemanii]|uniref:Flagellar hook-associated protein 2 n=1 Tax=Enterococcus lemanii TaxID=1159752 RepID=A0ABV9MYH5_9ENTE|nr:flagellar filament capping protein FliD [Enterococcus lemanii]MBM7708095.1 flagellar hook-associated protein 2 [Enterococcus lemanii]
MANITSSSGISSMLGQYSGIGSDQIEQLLAADKVPKIRAQNRIELINKQKTAWSDVKTRLNNLLNKIENLQKPETFQSKKVTTSDEKVATISGDAEALEGKYQLTVERLATQTSVIGEKIADSNSSLGSDGELTIKTADLDEDGNRKEFKINVSSDDSLKDVMKKINIESKNSGVSAIIMDNRLVLTDSKAGSRDLEITGTIAEDLGIGTGSTKTVGVDAKFNLNGIDMTRSSNVISDVIDGVTLELKNTSEKSIDLTLENDTAKTKETIKEFVDQYNSLMSFISDSISVGDPSAEDNKTGALSGDSTLSRLQNELRNLIAPRAVEGTTLKAAELGISISDRYGTLSFDESKFDEVLKKDPESIKDFFYKSEKISAGSDPKITGYTVALKELTDKYLVDKTGDKGVIASKFSSFDLTIKDLNKQIERFDDLIDRKKTRYVNMFTRLDQAMMQAEEQMSWLINQVNSFNGGQ